MKNSNESCVKHDQQGYFTGRSRVHTLDRGKFQEMLQKSQNSQEIHQKSQEISRNPSEFSKIFRNSDQWIHHHRVCPCLWCSGVRSMLSDIEINYPLKYTDSV